MSVRTVRTGFMLTPQCVMPFIGVLMDIGSQISTALVISCSMERLPVVIGLRMSRVQVSQMGHMMGQYGSKGAHIHCAVTSY